MSFKKEARDCVSQLARLVIDNKDKRQDLQFGFKSGPIPDDIEVDRSEGDSLFIYGEEYAYYRKCLGYLREEIGLEYMADREIDRELWHLVCEILIESDNFKKPATLKQKLTSFEQLILKPLEKYEVLVPIHNLKLGENAIKIAGVKMFEMNEETAIQWGIVRGKPLEDALYEEIADHAVAILPEIGNDLRKVVKRAKENLRTVLNLLRVALTDHTTQLIMWKIWDEHMLFRQGEHYAIRKEGNPDSVSVGWERSFRSLELVVDSKIQKQIDEIDNFTQDLFYPRGIEGRIRDQLIRAIEWTGNSITREDEDDKVVDLCTALETLLTTEQDKKKGECIALRMVLLRVLLDKPFFLPAQLLYIYEKRSEIIHGSKRRICTTSDYNTARMITIEVFRDVLAYIRENKITKHSAFLSGLQRDKKILEKAIDWLRQFNDEHYNDIRKVAEELFAS